MKTKLGKRIGLFALALAMLLGTLLGCGEKKQEETKTEPVNTEQVSFLDSVYNAEAGKGKFCIYFINATRDYVTDSSVTHAGDSTLLVSPEGKTMLIDLNNAANGGEIVSALQRLGINTLDYLVFSHPHADHIGSYPILFRYITVKQVIKNSCDYSEQSSLYADMMREIEEKQIPVTIMKEGDTFQFGDKVDVTVMNPPEGYDDAGVAEAQNSGSLLLRFVYGQSSYLTGGDLYAAQEQILIDKYGEALKSDVVKLNHHGYDTSNTKAWITTVSPKIACCEANGVNSDLVEGRYRLVGATTFFTALDGTVVVRTSGDGTYEVQAEQNRTVSNYGTHETENGYMTIK
jgi:competence protein ComEC